MKEITVNPCEIIIQENLENVISNEYNKFKYYLGNNTDKKVVTTLYDGHLIALDGNKLCAIKRALKKDVEIIHLESEVDFRTFIDSNYSEIYTSRLLTYCKWKEFEKNLEFYMKQYKTIDSKDYFSYARNIEKFKLCLKNNFGQDIDIEITYKGLSLVTRNKLCI